MTYSSHDQNVMMNEGGLSPAKPDKDDRDSFIEYLESVIIPDCEAEGRVVTADNFRRCIRFMESEG